MTASVFSDMNLASAEEALGRGDIFTARKAARILLKTPETAPRAREILDATGVDWMVTVVVGGCLFFFALVSVLTISR